MVIGYESNTGSHTRRAISAADLSGGSLFAYCHLRNDERVFTVARVRSVAAAP